MIFLPYRRGSKKHAYIYFGICGIIVLAYILTSSEQGNYSSVYVLLLSQIIFNLGLYCLLPKDMFEKLDVGGFMFIFLPLAASIIAMVVIALLFGSSLSQIISGSISSVVYILSYLSGLIAGLSLYILISRRAVQYNQMIRKIAEGK